MTEIPFLDLTRQHHALKAELMAAVARVLDSSRFVLGDEGRALEGELAARAGVRHGVGLGSGTDALRLALIAVGVKPGDEVITPAFSFVASASTIVMAGATPVFVDVEPVTFGLDPGRLEHALTRPAGAVHGAGSRNSSQHLGAAATWLPRLRCLLATACLCVGLVEPSRPPGSGRWLVGRARGSN